MLFCAIDNVKVQVRQYLAMLFCSIGSLDVHNRKSLFMFLSMSLYIIDMNMTILCHRNRSSYYNDLEVYI